jgi:hypothetical protein
MKQINQQVPLLGQVRAFTEEQKTNRFHEFVLSTESVDRHGTVFKLDGWQLDRYNNENPVVSFVHEDNNSDPDLIIGRGEVFRDGNQIIGRVYYEPEDINPLAEKIRKKVEHGTLRMASVSALPFKGHFGVESNNEDRDVLYFDEQELLAWSIVPVGSNRDALKRSAEALDTIKKEIVRDAQKDLADEDFNQVKDKENERSLSISKARCLIYNYNK